MNHYEKLAVFIIRLASLSAVLYGLMWLISAISVMSISNFFFDPVSATWIKSSVLWLVFGVVGFALSKPLGRLIGKDL